jgi:predicted RNA-binding protein YlqC (UPF0109 family)
MPLLGELVATLARSLVDVPAEVEVAEFEQGGATVVELRVARDDIGKVIGKSGRTAEALRVLLSAAASKQNKRVHLDIID